MTPARLLVEERLAGRSYRFFETIPSTMDAAREWLADEAPNGAIVIAGTQTAGRGRLGRQWHNAGRSALALSVILTLSAEALHQVPMLGGLVVYDTLHHLKVPGLVLKWPNDILVGTRKISGVLVETAWDGSRLTGAILGIGLNISGGFNSPDIVETAISLADVLETAPDYGAVLSTLVGRLDDWLPALGTPQMYHAWRGRLNTIGLRVRVESSAVFEGIAEDTTESGALLVRADDGQLRTVLAGDVRLRSV